MQYGGYSCCCLQQILKIYICFWRCSIQLLESSFVKNLWEDFIVSVGETLKNLESLSLYTLKVDGNNLITQNCFRTLSFLPKLKDLIIGTKKGPVRHLIRHVSSMPSLIKFTCMINVFESADDADCLVQLNEIPTLEKICIDGIDDTEIHDNQLLIIRILQTLTSNGIWRSQLDDSSIQLFKNHENSRCV